MVALEQLRTSVPRHGLPGRQLSLYVRQVQLELVEDHPLDCLSERTTASVPHPHSPQCLYGHRGELQSAPGA